MISLAHNTSHQNLRSERESASLRDFGIESASEPNIIEKILHQVEVAGRQFHRLGDHQNLIALAGNSVSMKVRLGH